MITQTAVLLTVVGLKRVGVGATAGRIARTYGVSRYRAKKVLEELAVEELVGVWFAEHRPGITKKLYKPTILGMAVAQIIENYDKEIDQEIQF